MGDSAKKVSHPPQALATWQAGRHLEVGTEESTPIGLHNAGDVALPAGL